MYNSVLKIVVVVVLFFECTFYGITRVPCNTRSNPSFEILHEDYDHNTIVVYKNLNDQKHSYIYFIRDHEGRRYVIKQDKAYSLKAEFQVVFEMLSAYMAQCVGVSAHEVELLPIGLSFPGKVILERPATIHTFVPGSTLRERKNISFSRFSIKQGGRPQSSAKGLTKRVIESMSFHQDLPPIVALDTFIANRDRNKANLIYDKQSDRFYAIDMALIYDLRYEDLYLPEIAIYNIKAMVKNKVLFNKSELMAIQQYREVLLDLLELFPSERIYSLLWDFTEQAGLTQKYDHQVIHDFLGQYKSAIERSCTSNRYLSALLLKVLKRSRIC